MGPRCVNACRAEKPQAAILWTRLSVSRTWQFGAAAEAGRSKAKPTWHRNPKSDSVSAQKCWSLGRSAVCFLSVPGPTRCRARCWITRSAAKSPAWCAATISPGGSGAASASACRKRQRWARARARPTRPLVREQADDVGRWRRNASGVRRGDVEHPFCRSQHRPSPMTTRISLGTDAPSGAPAMGCLAVQAMLVHLFRVRIWHAMPAVPPIATNLGASQRMVAVCHKQP
jgi:hypothetical protein